MSVGFEDCTRCIIILLYKVYHYLELFYHHSDTRRYVWISQNDRPGWFEVWPMKAIKWPGSGRGALVD